MDIWMMYDVMDLCVQGSKGRRARRRSSRKTDAESDESDSEGDQLTSSRTESSNQLDAAKARQSQCMSRHLLTLSKRYVYHVFSCNHSFFIMVFS